MDPTLDAFQHIRKKGVPRVILCKRWLRRADRSRPPDREGAKWENDRLEHYAGPDGPVEQAFSAVWSLDMARDEFVAPGLAREMLLTGDIRYNGQAYPSYDHKVKYKDQVEIARGFELCRELALQSPNEAATNADSIVLFGIGQNLPLPPRAGIHQALSLGL